MFDLPCGLRLRGFRSPPSSDIDNIVAMDNNIQVAPTLSAGFLVPQGQKYKDGYREYIESNKVEIYCVIETIPEATVNSKEPENDPATQTLGGRDDGNKSDKKLEPEFVGIVTLKGWGERGMRHTEYGIALMPQFWGKGYGTEITKFMIDHAFIHMNMHRISLQVFEGNDAAIALYRKCGFVDEGRLRKAIWRNGGWIDMIQMGLLVDEWKESREKGEV